MISFEELDAPLGAFVRDFDPVVAGTAGFATQLAAGLLEHSVLVFRGTEISAADLVQLGRALGELEILPEPEKRHPDHPEIFNLTNVRPDGQLVRFDDPQSVFLRGTQRWHTDSSFRKIPALCTMLYAIEVVQRGGQTQFADMRKVLGLLPPEDQIRARATSLVHSYEYSRANNPGTMNPMTDEERAKYPPVEHPFVRTHSDGTESLYMGGHVSHVVGMAEAQGRQWLEEIEAQLPVHDVIYEHQWEPHDLVIWDNRTTLHRLLGYDISNERRVMRRITVAGTDPVA